MKEETKVEILFRIASTLITLASLGLLVGALFGSGFGGIFPLWGRFLGLFFVVWIFTQHRIEKILIKIVQGKISQKQMTSYAVKRLVFIIIAVVAILFWHHNVYQKYLQKVYINFFPESTLKNVKLKSGHYHAWTDYRATLAFVTDKDTFHSLVKDYEIIPKKDLRDTYFGQSVMVNPAIIYYYNVVPTKDKYCEEFFIAWDAKGGIVSFQGRNSNYIEILLAKVNILQGTVVTENMIEREYKTWTQIGKSGMQSNAKEPVGKVAVKDILMGEQITWSALE